jgi:plastocyanin
MFDIRTRAVTIALVAAGPLAFASCIGAEPSGDVAPGPGGPDAVPVTAVDTRFEPDRLELSAGQEIQVEIHNEGSGTHDFTIETLDLSTGPIRSGEVANATFTVPEGETPFECTLHPGMDGVIVGT